MEILRKQQNIVALISLVSLAFGAIYGYCEFFKGQIFAETSQESNQENGEEKTKTSEFHTKIDSENKADPIDNQKTGKALDAGWKLGTANDSFEKKGNKISWEKGAWWYTYNRSSWVFRDSIEATLIINGNFLAGTSESTNGGFLWAGLNESIYTVNVAKTMLKRSFSYKTYQIDLIQQLLEDGSVEISYQITNNNEESQKIGVSQYVDILDNSFVRVLNDFKGLNVSNSNSLAMIPDPETMPNWAASSYGSSSLMNFTPYSSKTADGLGWESGKRYRNGANLLNPPENLKENQPMDLNDSGAVMKNPGVMVSPGGTAIFKQRLKYGGMIPPTITVEQKNGTMYRSESFEITGTVSDVDNSNYRLYAELDDPWKTLIPLKDFKNIPLQETQNYTATFEGKKLSAGNHTVPVIAIDEYGARSEGQKINFIIREVSGTPLVQKVKLGEELDTSLTKLFKDIKGTGTKLKNVAPFDSTMVGFQWVEATLVDDNLKEETFKIPVTVYNPQSTIFNDPDNLTLSAKNAKFTVAEMNTAIEKNSLDELILQKSEASSWQMEDGQEASLSITSQTAKPQVGRYEATIRATKKDTNKILEKKIVLLITNQPLENGWELGASTDFIEKSGNKINWNNGNWWYTYNGANWVYTTPSGNSTISTIEAALIINGSFLAGTSEDRTKGFLWGNQTESLYTRNTSTNTLKRSFVYKTYQIDLIQQLLEDGTVEISYQVTNNNQEAQKIGVSQYVDLIDASPPSVSVLKDFKGFHMLHYIQPVVVMPDPETMPNWVVSAQSTLKNFQQYSSQTVDGVGWETKKYYWNGAKQLNPPVDLKEGQAVNNLGDLGVAMKNPGVTVLPGEATTFKQRIKFGGMIAPEITLDQKNEMLYTNESMDITGSISDVNSHSYRLYLEMDDKNKSMIPLVDYNNIPYNEVQTYQAKIEGKLFSVGSHNVSVVGIDEYGSRSAAQKITLTINELSGVPKIQKIKLGETISNDPKVLFQEVKGTNVTLKNPLAIDSSVIGFQWVEATLIDNKQKEFTEKIPVNVYNPESTVFNDSNKSALDAKNTFFDVVEVRKSAVEETLNELVYQKVAPKAWDITNGTEISVELSANSIQPEFGQYRATFKGTRANSEENIQKDSILAVGGELKFKTLPKNLDYKPSRLGQKNRYVERMESDWKIELENTIGSNWSLFASVTPFENQAKEKLNSALILKNGQTQEVVMNETSQKIATGSETFPTIQWAETAGLLLKVSPDAKIGSYQGEITWLLSDAP